MLYLGCPMWGLKSWVGNFFPPKTKQSEFLSLYSRRLNTVEGNTTFYATPSAETVARWRDDTPPGFKFCLKFPQAITHHKRLRNAEAETAEFLNRLETLGDRCGPAFLQLPPTFNGTSLPALSAYLATLPRDFAYAIEPRHADFFSEPTETKFDRLMQERGLARLVFDTRGLRAAPRDTTEAVRDAQDRKPNFPVRFTRTAPFAFTRYVSHPTLNANPQWLTEWAGQVAPWLARGDDVFFFLHYPDDTYAPEVARLFHALVAARVPLPPLPVWNEDVESASQPNLF